jgi:endonuclease G, mitochondrial
VPLPGLGRWADQVAVRIDVSGDAVLRYHHYSAVVVSEWRMPLFSAVNVDGTARRRKVARTDVWKLDPRIPAKCQILQECYGREREGFFSRGHMTRREDANWGPAKLAALADADTFHATNAVPQAQSFNSPIWLGLEAHLLKHTNADQMKVSVVTGPVFSEAAAVMFGVRIPSQFWKVIAFVHERSKKLTAVGYLASQSEQVTSLRDVQYVFGRYRDWQVPIRRLARISGLDFGTLTSCDPLSGADERFAFQLGKLTDVYTQ